MNIDHIRPRMLVVSAHPDDAEFTCGGSLAHWASQGWVIRLIVCTDGSKGSPQLVADPAHLARRRRQEQERAAAVLGLRSVSWLGHSDGELHRCQALLEQLTRQIRAFRPGRILTWDPWRRDQLHPDHRRAGFCTLDAVMAASNPNYFPHHHNGRPRVHQVPEVLLYGTDAPDTYIDISATFETKLQALRCHQSQVEWIADLEARMQRCNGGHGQAAGVQYAEAYKLLRPFCDL